MARYKIGEVEHTALAVLYLAREARTLGELAPQVHGFLPARIGGALRRLRGMGLVEYDRAVRRWWATERADAALGALEGREYEPGGAPRR